MQGSLRIVDDCGLTFLHVFPVLAAAKARRRRGCRRSPRPVVKERAARLREKGDVALDAYLRSQLGREVELLMERDGIGRTPQFAEVEVMSGGGHVTRRR